MDIRDIIKQAAFDLFSQRKFQDITVQNIIDRAKCSRYSFYRYFRDKYELMHLYYTSYVTELLLNTYNGSNYPDIQEKIFRFIQDNRGYFKNVKDLKGTESFWNFLQLYATSFFTEIKQINENRQNLTEEERYEMQFVVNGANSIFQKYVEDRNPVLSPKQVSDLLCAHYPDEYYILSPENISAFRAAFSRAAGKPGSGRKK